VRNYRGLLEPLPPPYGWVPNQAKILEPIPSTHDITTLYLIVKHQIGHEQCTAPGKPPAAATEERQVYTSKLPEHRDNSAPSIYFSTQTFSTHQPNRTWKEKGTATPPSETWNARHPNAPTDRKAYTRGTTVVVRSDQRHSFLCINKYRKVQYCIVYIDDSINK
jgi:hypothetical protein